MDPVDPEHCWKIPAEGKADLLPDGEGGEDEMADIQPGTPRGGQVSQLVS